MMSGIVGALVKLFSRSVLVHVSLMSEVTCPGVTSVLSAVLISLASDVMKS